MDAAVRTGLDATAADPLVGAYRATQLFCFLPDQLVLSVSIVLFPMLARAHRDADRAALALRAPGVLTAVLNSLGWLVRRAAGTVVAPATVLRVVVALGSAVGVARLLASVSPLATPAFCVLVAAAYLLVLILLRELGGSDWQAFQRIVARKSTSAR